MKEQPPQFCKITMHYNSINNRRTYLCGEPLAPGSKFCEKHEADRQRLMVVPEHKDV